MPLTKFQRELARLLAQNRSADSHLAGGAVLLFSPNSARFSNDLDFFHDSAERLADAFASDRAVLERSGYAIEVGMSQPGFIRAVVRRGDEATKLEWVHDTAWRFMPALPHPELGFQLHPIDVAVNKVLALAGRTEPRDFLDVLFIHREILPLGALCWAGVGKDPGFTPLSLLELLQRKGRYRPEDFARLQLAKPLDLPALKQEWLAALEDAHTFVASRPGEEIGCLYYSPTDRRFVQPSTAQRVAVHFGRPSGVVPDLFNGDELGERWVSATTI